ncbi:MAG: tRNA 2-thiouridine(34) synthase MnmA [Firmicutes bacterium]|nr:tRNA 2-thiouridine(34) synthase MnmA [Bacillota bacterium]
MSGGVDSALAAALLAEEGWEVIGITLRLWTPEGEAENLNIRGCCSLEAVEDARAVARRLGIKHYVLNFRDIFEQDVVEYFALEYRRGRTPNPCIACNRRVKFERLLVRARALGADRLATGHYARIRWDPERNRHLLLRPQDRRKDQTYVLYAMTQPQLARTLFPLGGLTKQETRNRARKMGLPVADKAESQDLCFIPGGDYRSFFEGRGEEAPEPGPFLDLRGRVLGTHRGIPYYTVGQRRGLGIPGPHPLYVVGIDPDRNAVLLGDDSETHADGLIVSDTNLIPFEDLEGEIRARVKIRYGSPAVPATVTRETQSGDRYVSETGSRAVMGAEAGSSPQGQTVTGAGVSPDPGRWIIRFDRPQRAVTPGQAAVLYDAGTGDTVLGGGTIDQALPKYP